MFDKELVEIVLKNKEDKIKELQSQQPVNKTDIDNLTKEIEYLKALLVRYEIAVLLKLEKDEDYIKCDFLGIEEENVSDYNLSQDEEQKYNQLIAQLPKEQLQRYKIRKQMADILGTGINDKFNSNNGYVGIENTNPNLSKYNLNQQQIKEFNDLLNRLNKISADTTRKVDVSEEALRMLEDAYNKLNISDIDTYNKIKDKYLNTIDSLINKIGNEKTKSVFSGVSNYELASLLTKKYPNMNVVMDIKCVEKLLNLLSSSNNIPEYEYDEYVNLLCKNIEELYKDDNNKKDIEQMLNNVNSSDYKLRHLLSSKLTISNVNLSIQDNELATVVRFLDDNYDSLPANDIKIYLDMVESKIKEGISDINKIDNINNIFSTIKNKSLYNRFQKLFSKNEFTKFDSQHVTSYDSLVIDQIKRLEKKKQAYMKRRVSGVMSSFYDVRIREIDKEIERLKSFKSDYDNNSVLGLLDSRYNKKTDNIIRIQKEIQELKKLKSQVTSPFHQKIIDKKIAARNKRIDKLRRSKVKIAGIQKKIMTPKLWLKTKRNMVRRHFESKTEIYQDYSNSYQKMAETERQLGGMFSGIKAMFYEFKANRYKSKSDFNAKICNIFRNSHVKVKGANKKKINKNNLNQLRQNNQQQVATV